MRHASFLLAAAVGVAASAGAEEPAKNVAEPAQKYQVVSPKDDGIIATGINGRGDVIGFEWAEEKDHPGVVSQVPFFARGKAITYLPLLEGYTATFPAAVSDDGAVVGRASKPAPPGVRVNLRNQAFLWDAKGGIRGLGTLKDDTASFACGISRDGRRISGYSVGDNRVRACIWQREGNAWVGTPLPQMARLGSHVVAMSGNGNFVAAVDGIAPCLWTRQADGTWMREQIGDAESLIPRAVNDSATVVGLRFTGDGATHAVVWTRAAGSKSLQEPRGYVKSEANAVNDHGVVAGTVDGPNGSPIGPNAFVYEAGRLRLIEVRAPIFTSATCLNNNGQVSGVIGKDDE